MDELETVGKNIELARTLVGWSQAELAEAMSVDQQYISKVEKGKLNISMKTLARFASALGKEPKDLLEPIRIPVIEAKKATARRRRAA